MPEWTREQRAAIDARNHTILVSAAAGSGKTAVLIERIVTLLREGARLDRMMICTFTRAAAAEMRERLNKRLTDEAATQPELMGRALDELEGAEISTIHSFCQRMLREEFQAAGIDPLASICEEQKRVAMFREAYTAAFNELLEEQHPESRHVNARGQAMELGAYDATQGGGYPGLCFHHKAVQEEGRRYLTQLIKEISRHPSLLAYDCWNGVQNSSLSSF